MDKVLDRFGELLVRHVRDRAVEVCDRHAARKMRGRSAGGWTKPYRGPPRRRSQSSSQYAVKEQPTLGSSVDLVILNGSNLGETAAIAAIGQRVLGPRRSTPTVAQVASWL